MRNRVRAALTQPSLKLAIIGIIFVVLVPTLGVVTAALYGASRSFYDASARQLLETARTVARSTVSELDLTANVLTHLVGAAQSAQDSAPPLASFANGTMQSHALVHEAGQWQWAGTAPADPALRQIVLQAAQAGRMQLSNIVMPDSIESAMRVIVAMPSNAQGNRLNIATLTTAPQHLLHALASHGDSNLSVILAITDGNGRILERSVDGARLTGKVVPDWALLSAQTGSSGSLLAQTLEGGQIFFAFQRIEDTPGWVAVVGESAASLQQRSQQPLQVLWMGTAVTMCVALLLALFLARQVLKPIQLLAERAQRIAADQTRGGARLMADVPPSFVAEFETLRQSLDQADDVLQHSLQESHRAEQEAQAHLAVLKAAEEQARIGHWSLDTATGVLQCSDMISVLFGGPQQATEMQMEGLRSKLTPDSFERMQKAASQCLQDGTAYAIEVEHVRIDQSTFTAFLRGWAVRDVQGQIVAINGTLQDISESKEQHERLAALADNLPSGVIFRWKRLPGERLVLQFLSAGLEFVTGLSAQAVLKDQGLLLRAMALSDVRRLLRVLQHAQRSGHVLDETFEMHLAAGVPMWIHCRAALRYPGTGGAVWDGIARDVTAERAADEALRAAKDKAESAERAKSDFLATMSHEIRTPMNTVIGMARLAMRTPLNPQQRNYLGKINESANVLLDIINDILDFSKIEAGGLVLEGAPFRLESVLDTVAALNALKAEEKGLEMTYAMVPGLPAVVRGDALRLGQVLTNLVSNAIKFTPAGDVVVRVGWSDEGQSSMLHFAVSDSGIGLSTQQIAQLFQPFSQAQTDTARRYGGTGLGLAISKRLVEMMGGTLAVDSEEGVGSTFFFTIPLDAVQTDAEDGQAPSPETVTSLRGQRILIADDNHMAREALAEMARGFGMTVTLAQHGQEALDQLKAYAAKGMPFDTVVLDWHMPVMDGVQAAREIKAAADSAQMPAVLMVTAHGQEAMLQAAQGLALQGVLLKPVTQSAMFNTLLGARHGQSVHKALRSQAAYVPVDMHRFAGLQGLRVLVADDNALNREVATDFLVQVGVQVLTAVDGEDAIRCLQSQHIDVLLMDIHMPRMDGLAATRAIRREPRWQQLPIIALTAQARSEDLRTSKEAGMNGHLTKPIDEVALYQTLLGYCHRQGQEGVEQPVTEGFTRADAGSASASAAPLFPRLSRVPARRAQLLRGFLHDFSPLAQQIPAWIDQQQWAQIAIAAHQIKGSASYLDAAVLCTVADQLETVARGGQADAVRAHSGAFVQAVQMCLQQVQSALDAMGPAHVTAWTTSSASAPLAQIRALVEQVRPLLVTGNFAAQQLLEDLVAATAGTPAHAMSCAALEAFEELDAEQALVALADVLVYCDQRSAMDHTQT